MARDPAAPFACDLPAFKRQVSRFCQHVEGGVTGAPLAAAWKCVTLHYLNMTGDEADRLLARSYLEFAAHRYTEASLLRLPPFATAAE